jgi:hypothetical protein
MTHIEENAIAGSNVTSSDIFLEIWVLMPVRNTIPNSTRFHYRCTEKPQLHSKWEHPAMIPVDPFGMSQNTAALLNSWHTLTTSPVVLNPAVLARSCLIR